MQNNNYIQIDFYKLWRYIKLTRLQKEKLKLLIFSSLPFLFGRLATFQNWKHAQVFAFDKEHKKQYQINNVPNSNAKVERNNDKSKPINKLAIVIHAFYLDVFNEIMAMIIPDKDTSFKFFITCPANLKDEIESKLKKTNSQFTIMEVDNHGRDILPFLNILPLVFNENFEVVLKIHTKRSNHLNKENLWRTTILEELIGGDNIATAINIFEKNPHIGMIGPANNILPMSLYYGGNASTVELLCEQMNLTKQQMSNFQFVAGSMFYARKEVLIPVLKLGLNSQDFEKEDNQLDSTMAHAVERIFSAGLIVSGLKLADTSSSSTKINCHTTLNHPFTL